jgi:SAM-dependent methyltransferase
MTPSPFVVQWAPRVVVKRPAPQRALDVAMGRGRHIETLAGAGFEIYGIDRDWSALSGAIALGRELEVPVKAWCLDLTTGPLPSGRFDLVLVTRYLQRDLTASLCEAVRPGGFLVYETFTRDQVQHRWGPRSPDHLLAPGELRSMFARLTVVFYEEVNESEAVARLVARRET